MKSMKDRVSERKRMKKLTDSKGERNSTLVCIDYKQEH